MPKRKRLTPKQRVLKKYPRAYVYKDGPWIVMGHNDWISDCQPTANAAWADAARRLHAR
jgi:hypothetical protein